MDDRYVSRSQYQDEMSYKHFRSDKDEVETGYDSIIEQASVEPNVGTNTTPIIIDNDMTDAYVGNLVIPTNAYEYNRLTNPSLIAHMEIYDILYRAKASHYVHDEIIKCIKRNMEKGAFDAIGYDYSRKTFLKTICRKYSTATPTIIPVHLDNRFNEDINSPQGLSRDTVEVICFDFETQLIDLLNDGTLFGDENNLVINKSTVDPNRKWLPYEKVDDEIFEVFDGDWYQSYAKKMIININKEFCCPIGLYIDASETVTYQRYSFQPLIMFPLILNNATRKKNHPLVFWR